jgi:uncharacterized membrane protein
MNKSLWIASAVAAALALPIVTASAEPVAQPPKSEKCYGVTKAGHNDCQTATSSCAGTSRSDNQKDAYVYLPMGVCSKISGGSLTPKTS